MFWKKGKPYFSPLKSTSKRSIKKDIFFWALGLALVLLAVLLYFVLLPLFGIFESKGVGFNIDKPTQEMPQHFLYELAPGDTVLDSFTVYNSFWDPIALRIYSLDGAIEGKNYIFDAYNEVPEGVGTWIQFQELIAGEELILEGRDEKQIFFDLTIPAETPLGDYYGTLSIVYSDLQVTQDENAVGVEINYPKQVRIRVVEEPQLLETWSGGAEELEGVRSENTKRFVIAFLLINGSALALLYLVRRFRLSN